MAATSEQTAKETISIERESKRYWILKYLSGMIGSKTTAFVIKKLTTNYKVLLDNTLTNAFLLNLRNRTGYGRRC
jgi:exoribonuclease R